MLLLNRRDAVKSDLSPQKERWGWALWSKAMMSRKLTDFLGGRGKNWLLKTFFRKTWGHFRQMPKVAEKSFSKLWQEKNKQDS